MNVKTWTTEELMEALDMNAYDLLQVLIDKGVIYPNEYESDDLFREYVISVGFRFTQDQRVNNIVYNLQEKIDELLSYF
jgi:hypothetical protein